MNLPIQSSRHTKQARLQGFLAGIAPLGDNSADGYACLFNTGTMDFRLFDFFGLTALLCISELLVMVLKYRKTAVALTQAQYPASGKGQRISETEVVRALLIAEGVPSSAISVVQGAPRSSWENVEMSADELRRLGVRTVLFVTAPYHSRRATLLWKKSAPDIDISTVSVVDTPPPELLWHTSFDVARVIAYEYLAIADYWFKGRV